MGLKRYAFRREYAGAMLERIGFSNLELVDSFDGFQEDVDKAAQEKGFLFSQTLGRGHKGCFFTMLREWQRMLDDDVSYRLFFEDDAIGHLDLPNGLGQKMWEATPKDFDIVYMGNMMGSIDSQDSIVQSPTYCLHAYILSRKGAKKLLKLAKEDIASGQPLLAADIQLVQWQLQKKIVWYCWNGTNIQKSYPTFDEGLPWQFFPNVITPQKDTGIFWQNMRVGTTLEHPTLQLTIPQYSR